MKLSRKRGQAQYGAGIKSLQQKCTTCQGNLIYDDVADVTWFDYTYEGPCPEAYVGATLAEANTWVEGLTVGGVTGWIRPLFASNCNILTCATYDCPECKVKSDNNTIGYLYWGTFGGSTQRGMLPFSKIYNGSGKSYWTSQVNPTAFSFYDGKLAQAERAYAMCIRKSVSSLI